MDGWMVGLLLGWIDGWMDGWMDGWNDGRLKKTNIKKTGAFYRIFRNFSHTFWLVLLS